MAITELKNLLPKKRGGSKITGAVFGGPFKEIVRYTGVLPGDATIKLAVELKDEPSVCAIPTQDFHVPPHHAYVRYAMLAAVNAMANGHNVYAGCMGGIGRTGTFFACLVAALRPGHKDPVGFVRANYADHAVETHQQREWVFQFVRQNQPFFADLRRMLHPLQSTARARTKKSFGVKARKYSRSKAVTPLSRVAS